MKSDLSHPAFALSSDLVDELVALYPDSATYLGVPGYDHKWPDLSPDGAAAIVDSLEDMRRRVADLPGDGTHFDRLAVIVASSAVDEEIALHAYDDHLRDLNSIASPIQAFREVFDHMSKDTPEGWENIVARLNGLPDAMANYQESLDLGLERGMAVAERQVRAAAEQCTTHGSVDSAFSDLAKSYAESGVGNSLAGGLDSAIQHARMAYLAMADWLHAEYLPRAVKRNAVGRERYVRAAHRFLGTDIDPQETYAWGWSEVADLRARMKAAAAEIEPGASLAGVLQILKTDPPRLAANRDEFKALMQDRTDEALARLAGIHFDVPDSIRTCVVRTSPPSAAPSAPTTYPRPRTSPGRAPCGGPSREMARSRCTTRSLRRITRDSPGTTSKTGYRCRLPTA